MGCCWSCVNNKYIPQKDDVESQQTTTEMSIQNDTINNELGTPKQIQNESAIKRRIIMGCCWSCVNNKYLLQKFQDDVELHQTTTEPRNQNDTIYIERGTSKQIQNESDINGRTEPRNQYDTINIELGTPKQIYKESDINRSNTEVQEYLMKQKDLKILALEEEVQNLTAEKESLLIRNNGQEYMMKQKDLKILALEEQVRNLTAEKESLLIRLSQICSVKLSDGNPNITDLSDPNRADKLVSRFSELYSNQWTDSFEALCESKSFLEENAIRDLLQIVLNVYQTCLEHTECQNKELVKAVQSFTGVKVGDKVEETIVQEYIHNLHIFRAKNYALKMADVKAEIGKSLQSSVDPEVYKICQEYITECTEVCWLMCVKSPPMYISAAKTDTFQQHLYTGYTTSGKYVSYVVWPTLFQYKDGPIMQRGVAQGTNDKM